MPNKSRGKAPNDILLFSDKWQNIFYEALKDVHYLLSRGYGQKSSIQITGNRYKINARQQKALNGMSASETSIINRKNREVLSHQIRDKTLAIDGFNLLIVLESALSGAYIFEGLDGAYRDVTGIHGGYKRISKTEEAIRLIGRVFQQLQVKKVLWYLDSPISNSGRLKTLLREIAEKEAFPWEIELVFSPDKTLIASEHIIVSSDAWILEECGAWFNMMRQLIENHLTGVELFHSKPPDKK